MKAMAEARIVVCGAGALGGNIVEGLARCGFKDIAVIDHDRVDEANLCTQPYTTVDCGTKKVMALGNLVEDSSRVVIECIDKRLDGRNAEKLLVGSLIVDVFDNSESRGIVHNVCLRKSIPCLHAGMIDGFSAIQWNEKYKIPKNVAGGDPCGYSLARTLAVITAAMTVEAIIRFVSKGEKHEWFFTLGDMKIS